MAQSESIAKSIGHRRTGSFIEEDDVDFDINPNSQALKLELYRWPVLKLIYFLVFISFLLLFSIRLFDSYSYVLVLDAGSTGTRIHVYKFIMTYESGSNVGATLLSEIFEERKPSLSSFIDNIGLVENQIDTLLSIANQHVSLWKRHSTLLVLRATAGLRLLKETDQQRILQMINQTFEKYPFRRPKMDISIINEAEEGIDAWLTLVYLKGELYHSSHIATLDLGGGSIQITYNPLISNTQFKEIPYLLTNAMESVDPCQITQSDEIKQVQYKENRINQTKEDDKYETIKYLHSFKMFDDNIHLYSKSYLNYGLMAARQSIFTNETSNGDEIKIHRLVSRCMPIGSVGQFKFQQITWTVKPLDGIDAENRWDSCLSQINDYIQLAIRSTMILDNFSLYTFSYFYDIALDAGLLIDSNDQSKITVLKIQTLKHTANDVCRQTHLTLKNPFLCFDLTYIYSLLTTGFGISEEQSIVICKKLRQYEVAWSLGLALKLLSDMEKEKTCDLL